MPPKQKESTVHSPFKNTHGYIIWVMMKNISKWLKFLCDHNCVCAAMTEKWNDKKKCSLGIDCKS